ncbi:MAG: WD40 repeat domain-containing protein, partial [Microcoleus sp.]
LWTSNGGDGWVYSVSFSPDGKMLASGSDYGAIKLWSLEGKELMRLKRSEAVRSVAWSSDGKWLASGSNDKTVRLWNLELLDLDRVLERGCEWVRGYLENNPNVEKIDRQLCDKKL